MTSILNVKNLNLSFKTYSGLSNVIRNVSLEIQPGETLAIVGESGSGKSVTAKAIMQLLPKQNSVINSGEITYDSKDLLQMTDKQMQKIRGSEIAMVFQDPMTSLNPTMTIGKQIMESLVKKNKMRKKEAYERAIELIELVGIPNPEQRMKEYPHQFSGGMRQRIVVAIAISCNPKILIADEPTTALDVTIQAQILDLMKDLQRKLGMSIIFITHDLGVVANIAHKVAVMYAGKIIETGTVEEIFYKPKHPYTWGLLNSMPKLHSDRNEPLVPIVGTPPNMSNEIKGCSFSPRCKYAMKVCHQFNPDDYPITDTHRASCWLLDERSPAIKTTI